MSLSDTQYEQIQKYLDNELEESEKIAFEQEIAENEMLAQEVALFQKLPQYIGEGQSPDVDLETEHPQFKAYLKVFLSDESKQLENELENIGTAFLQNENQETSNKVVAIYSRWKVLSAAAVVLVLFGSLWFLMKPTSSTALYSSYVQHDAIILNQRGNEDEISKNAEELYNQGNYEAAIPLLLKVNEQNLNFDVLLALGVSYLELDDYDNALAQFEAIGQSDAIIKDKALWYEAATYLKQNNRDLARQKLLQLQEEYPFFKAKETKKILRKLK
jgi:tetratricopeptide (TPR) repeat protein